MNFKNIHIGELISNKLKEDDVSIKRTMNFMKCTEQEVEAMLLQQDLSTYTLLRWSKLLEYDFFRIYSQHLILYAPQKGIGLNSIKYKKKQKSTLPQFKKNVYTKEIIDFIMKLIINHEKSIQEVIDDYHIPKTTLYKWLKKYQGV